MDQIGVKNHLYHLLSKEFFKLAILFLKVKEDFSFPLGFLALHSHVIVSDTSQLEHDD